MPDLTLFPELDVHVDPRTETKAMTALRRHAAAEARRLHEAPRVPMLGNTRFHLWISAIAFLGCGGWIAAAAMAPGIWHLAVPVMVLLLVSLDWKPIRRNRMRPAPSFVVTRDDAGTSARLDLRSDRSGNRDGWKEEIERCSLADGEGLVDGEKLVDVTTRISRLRDLGNRNVERVWRASIAEQLHLLERQQREHDSRKQLVDGLIA